MQFSTSPFWQMYLPAVLALAVALALWRFVYVPLFNKYRARQLEESLNTLQLFIRELTRRKDPQRGDSSKLLSEELRNIFSEIGRSAPKLSRLLNIVQESVEHGDTSRPALVSDLEAVARQVDAARRRYSVNVPMYSSLTMSKGDASSSLGESKNSDESEFKPNEAALLAGLTEKFYGSAAFKALGLALAGAVLLGGAGIVFIGSQSLNLRDSLNQTADTQQKALKETAEQQQGSLISASKSALENINSAMTQITSQAPQ